MDEIKLLDATDNALQALQALRSAGWIIKSPYFNAAGEPVFIAVRRPASFRVRNDHDHEMITELSAH